jgi:hypothetical protein
VQALASKHGDLEPPSAAGLFLGDLLGAAVFLDRNRPAPCNPQGGSGVSLSKPCADPLGAGFSIPSPLMELAALAYREETESDGT